MDLQKTWVLFPVLVKERLWVKMKLLIQSSYPSRWWTPGQGVMVGFSSLLLHTWYVYYSKHYTFIIAGLEPWSIFEYLLQGSIYSAFGSFISVLPLLNCSYFYHSQCKFPSNIWFTNIYLIFWDALFPVLHFTGMICHDRSNTTYSCMKYHN